MSMNLHCNHIELWQTPTYITYMCMATHDGYSFEFKGIKAKRALRAYMRWVMSMVSFFAGDDKAYKIHLENRKWAQEHCDAVENILKRRGLRVSIT